MNLPARLAHAGLLPPSYGTDSLCAALPAVAGALGVELTVGELRSDEVAVAWGLEPARAVILVLVDGLGDENLREASKDAPFLRSHLARSRTLRTGFPATTATSLGAVGTGHGPGRTGLVGYTARNPNTGELATLVSWRGAGVATEWQREAHLMMELAAAVPVARIGPAKFADSGLTQAALSGGRYCPADDIADRIDLAAYEAGGGGFVYLYLEQLDAAGHVAGVNSPLWRTTLTQIDRELARLATMVPRGTTIVVVADHGMVTIGRRVDVAATALLTDVQMMAGEPRAVHLYSDSPHAVAERWRQETNAVVALRSEAIDSGLFGQVSPHVVELIGDVIVLATGNTAYVNSATATPAALALKGHHGSLTPTEATVPLVVLT